MNLLKAVRIIEKTPGAHRFVFGAPQPTDREIAVPCAAFDDIEASDAVTVRCTQDAHVGHELASSRVIRFVWSKAERHPVGERCDAPEGRARRLEAFMRAVAKLPKEVDADLVPFLVGACAHAAIGAYALNVEDVVGEFPNTDEVEKIALAAIEGGTFYEFDIEGRKLDEQHAAEELAKELADEAERRRAEEEKKLDEPCDRAFEDEGWLAFECDASAQPPLPRRQRPQNDPKAAVLPIVRGKNALYIVPRSLLLGADAPWGLVEGVNILDGSLKIPCTKRELPALRATVTRAVYGANPEKRLTPSAITFLEWFFEKVHEKPQGSHSRIEHDETTEEGRYRVELFERLIGDGFLDAEKPGFATRLAFDAGMSGVCLAEDVTVSALHRLMRAAWLRSNTKPEAWDEKEKRKAEGWTAEEYHASHEGPTKLHVPPVVYVERSRKGGEKRTPYVAKTWAPPAIPSWCATEKALLAMCRKLAAGKPPLFRTDELYVSSEEGLVERVKSIFTGGDEWAPLLAACDSEGGIERNGERILPKREIDGALAREGLVDGKPTAPEYQRIHRIMTKLGWKTGERTVDGERQVKVWIKPTESKS